MKNKSIESLNFCEETITKKHLFEVAWLELCARVKEIRDNKLYEGRWDSFEDFLIDPQMGLDKSVASRMITIHEKFILEYKISPARIANIGGWSKAAEILGVVKDKKSAEEWIDKATSLSKSDLRKEIKESQTGIKMSDCKHKDFYLVKICRKCGDRIEEHNHD